MTEAFARRLERLDGSVEPEAERFDKDETISGRVVVLPSAFNPPTLGHQHLLERALQAHGAGQAVALLTTRNVDKGVAGASLADRVGMLLAVRAEWDDLAVVASNQGRFVDQATALTRAYPAAEFDFIVGFDTLERLFAPRYYDDMWMELEPFFERHRVLAANRGSVLAGQVGEWLDANTGRFRRRLSVLEIDEFPASLSSTQVRAALSEGGADTQLTAGVRRYIEERGLYAAG